MIYVLPILVRRPTLAGWTRRAAMPCAVVCEKCKDFDKIAEMVK
jgi:hypothetical protein